MITPKHSLELQTKYIVPCESTAQEVYFELWLHHMIKSHRLIVNKQKLIQLCKSTVQKVSFVSSHHIASISDDYVEQFLLPRKGA